jgi:Mrp family chromosome partitioning ATPase
MRERKQKQAEEDALKKSQSYKSPKPKAEQNLPTKEDRTKFVHRNPEAKFVLTHELEVPHLLYSERHVGEVFGFPESIVEKLNALGMFNAKQGFQYMRKPICMIRPNTGLVARQLFAQSISHLGTKDRRVVVAGKHGTGKSFILLQMAALALMQRYVVIAVPRGLNLQVKG